MYRPGTERRFDTIRHEGALVDRIAKREQEAAQRGESARADDNLDVLRSGLATYREQDGRLHGVIYAALELKSFQDYVSKLPVPFGVTEFVTDGAGVVVATTGEHTQLAGKPLAESFLSEAIRTREASAGEVPDGNGQEWVYAIYPTNALGAAGLVVTSITAKKTVLHAALERLRKDLLALLVITSAALLLAWRIGDLMLAKPVVEIRPPEDIPQLVETLKNQKAQAANEVTLRHRLKNGEVITVEMSTHVLSWDGHPARVVIAYDVSSRDAARQAWPKLQQMLEREVAQRTRELQLANEELESFSYSVSHDLRAPLAVVDGYCDAIVHRHGAALPEEVRHYLERIRVGAGRMNALIDDLLSFSRTARAPIQSEQLDLTVLARGVVDQLRQRFPDRNVDVQIEEGLQASGDPALITVLLTNLIGNAWKFTSKTPAGGPGQGATFFFSLPVAERASSGHASVH